MDFNTQDKQILPTTSNDDVAKDEYMIAVSFEVVDLLLPKLVEDKDETIAIDSSKTREFPDVRFDNVLSKENLEETIRLSRESPKVLSDNVSERMVEK